VRKKFKRLLSFFTATLIAVCALVAMNAFAATPKIYVDIVYENSTTIRADIKFSGMPKLLAGGFHVNFGSGWNISKKSNGNANYTTKYGTSSDCELFTVAMSGSDTVFVTFGGSEALSYNGTFVSFYVTKSSSYSSTNSVINPQYLSGDFLSNASGNSIISTTQNPVMVRADEFVIGDANGDRVVNSLDASVILSAINNTGSLTVSTIASNYKTYFPNAAAPAAPDANQSGVINKTDADKIVDYYATVAVGGSYSGNIGKKDIYETFKN
jgi:hypothetical protein